MLLTVLLIVMCECKRCASAASNPTKQCCAHARAGAGAAITQFAELSFRTPSAAASFTAQGSWQSSVSVRPHCGMEKTNLKSGCGHEVVADGGNSTGTWNTVLY